MKWLVGKRRDLAYRQDIVNIKTLEERPHSEVDVNQTSPKVQTSRKTRNHFQIRISTVVLGTGIKLDKVSSPGSRMCENLRYLKGVGLNVFREPCPRKGQIISHKIVYWVTRHKGYKGVEYVSEETVDGRSYLRRKAARKQCHLVGTECSHQDRGQWYWLFQNRFRSCHRPLRFLHLFPRRPMVHGHFFLHSFLPECLDPAHRWWILKCPHEGSLGGMQQRIGPTPCGNDRPPKCGG